MSAFTAFQRGLQWALVTSSIIVAITACLAFAIVLAAGANLVARAAGLW